MKIIAFILHDNRSGSTLFSSLANQVRGVSVSREADIVSQIIEYRGQLSSDDDVRKLVDYLFRHRKTRELGIDRSALQGALLSLQRPRTHATILRRVLETYFTQADPEASAWLVKHSVFHYLDLVRELIPGVKFVHVVRDGRAVFNSKRASTKYDGRNFESNLLKAAYDWRRRMRIAERAKEVATDSVIEITYEDLVLRPEETLEHVFDFLEISASERAATKSRQGYFESLGETQKAVHQNLTRRPLPERIRAWESELSDTQIALYEHICGAELESRGYVVHFPHSERTFSLRARVHFYHLLLLLHLTWTKMQNVVWRYRTAPSFRGFVSRRLLRRRYQRLTKAEIHQLLAR